MHFLSRSQLSSAVKLFPPKFALCLPSKTEDSGFGDLFIGGGSYFLPPYQYDASRLFTTVSLISNETSFDEYFFQVKSIEIDEKAVPLKSPMILSKLSTVVPFTVLHHSIYEPFVKEFKSKASSRKMVEAKAKVSSFEVCYRVKKGFNMEDVPVIDLTVGSGGRRWRIYGRNSMVVVKKGVMCLAFVRGGGGEDREEMVIVGGYQMEDSLVEIDLQSSKLSFTSSLLRYNTSCSHFRPVSTDIGGRVAYTKQVVIS
ncbi:PREDICTED: basic 7S globulin-like [Camelina sativa]|uniref:Basic 7S globulin-like n=1 Tax=Camelina sativa TaxID=90675 RepID=A0ABM0TCH0_CAMSA|nr:PREDICTED: basic 7S globulin-like [Camelina sativa]